MNYPKLKCCKCGAPGYLTYSYKGKEVFYGSDDPEELGEYFSEREGELILCSHCRERVVMFSEGALL